MRQAFGEAARADAGRVEGLQDREHRLDFRDRGAELLGDRREIAGQVAGLVDQIDEILADHAARRIGDRERELLGEMVGERALGRREGFEIVVAVVAAGRRRAAPFRIAERRLVRGLLAAGAVIVAGLLVGLALDARGRCRPRRPGAPPIPRPAASVDCAVGRAALRFGLGFGRALQQRIALELVVHVGGQVEIRQLQQLDGLHQLRRHHERLALTNFELLTERHRVPVENWSGSCLSGSGAGVYQFLPTALTNQSRG